jgi:aminoglycoside phosphotransferase (APT) family kinase protein
VERPALERARSAAARGLASVSETTSLDDWVERVTAQRVVSCNRIPGGGSRNTYAVETGDGARYLLRVDNGLGPLSKTVFTIGREHRILTALHAAGLAVPGIHGYSAEHDAMLMEYIEGRTSYQTSPSPAVQRRIQDGLMHEVVRLHACDPERLGLAEFADCRNVANALERDLGILGEMYRNLVLLKEPEIGFALRWLAGNVPDPARRSCLVHGDVGPGNFLFGDDGSILAVIDWEVAHVGHPLEDLAAVLCRALGVEFGSVAEHIASYERASGEEVDRRKLDYFVILVLTRWYIGLNLALSRPSVSQHVAVLTTYRQSVAYTLVCTLARQYSIDVPGLEPLPARQTTVSFIHDHVIEALDTYVWPALEDPFVADRARGVMNLAKYLRDRDAYGAGRQEADEQREIEAITGATYDGIEQAVAGICRHAAQVPLAEARPLVECLLGITRRRQTIWAAAMGPMAHRTIDYRPT